MAEDWSGSGAVFGARRSHIASPSLPRQLYAPVPSSRGVFREIPRFKFQFQPVNLGQSVYAALIQLHSLKFKAKKP